MLSDGSSCVSRTVWVGVPASTARPPPPTITLPVGHSAVADWDADDGLNAVDALTRTNPRMGSAAMAGAAVAT
jgi:hypothetical protein